MISGETVLSALQRYYDFLEYVDMPQFYSEMEMIDSVIENWFALSAEDVEQYSKLVQEIFG